nr:IAA-alanine resistance protein 1 [Tanacetum cinerariifolium]
LLVGSGFVSCSSIEHLPYAHVHWPEAPWKQSLYFRVYLGVGVGSVYISPPPYPAPAGLGHLIIHLAFQAGAMLGDAFLHQLPHAFGGGHSHEHSASGHDHGHGHDHDHSPSHSHSIKDLSVGLSILCK